MGIDKNCRYCGTDRVRSSCGGYVVCMCEYAKKEWSLSMEKESLKKRVSELSKQISELKDSAYVHQKKEERLLPIPPKVPKLKISDEIKRRLHRELKRQIQNKSSVVHNASKDPKDRETGE